MADNLYQQLSAQAWSQYQSVTSRSATYLKLLQPAYDSFLAAAVKVDGAVIFSSPPTADQLKAASNAVAILESAFAGVGLVVQKFVDMDAQAVKMAAAVSQKQMQADNVRNQATDSDFEMGLNNILYQAQLQVAAAIASSGS
ncbi:MAG: hypothetical protein ABID63_10935 [Pseudomonadota bacterium]